MIEKLFYIFPPEIIQQKFPNMKIDERDSFIEDNEDIWKSGIKYGWNPSMKGYCGLAFHFKYLNAMSDSVKLMEDTLFTWDKRLGKIIKVDPDLKENCWFVEKATRTIPIHFPISGNISTEKTIEGYRISKTRSSATLGCIVGIVRKDIQRNENNIFIKRGAWFGKKHVDQK